MAQFKSKSVGFVSSPAVRINAFAAPKVPAVGALWTAGDQHMASEEGWFVQRLDNGFYEIVDDMTLTFATPIEARAYVERRADQGSDLHERALAACVALTSMGKKNDQI